ncbi:hypothetical protein RhiirA5_415050 [Rhizophagus irregularis]|uniref:Uncharacterized protein n=1 Tax=Rhizophagus irregularis TaxID=588596 RepID=A0A2N0PSS5_9GLOM|nr:hypothetical protein RhiirA5_415050 [Rhizophagus irregularis]
MSSKIAKDKIKKSQPCRNLAHNYQMLMNGIDISCQMSGSIPYNDKCSRYSCDFKEEFVEKLNKAQSNTMNIIPTVIVRGIRRPSNKRIKSAGELNKKSNNKKKRADEKC